MVTAVSCQASASGDPGLVIKQAATEDPPEQGSREATPNGEEAQGKEGEPEVATVVRSEGVAAAAAVGEAVRSHKPPTRRALAVASCA